ncbi:TetR family transcriptional regulator [Spongiactinospora rosea]|uniref:TetR family transcriptional regulator n=1 Tax=Spongiactinospora rosea TaxID=2248750 RepID=A0A366LML0_9ACTN|nr:TetR/AcrR family transcriptional regulator [Spongiactinospora rosea]RBQ14402.1 TetR family transcriptional regulator [Spongiactinospora rosea]
MTAKPQYISVWAREAAERARPATAKPARDQPSRAQIVRAAIEILDTEGLDALSMRRLGAKLGMGATSIYWYVANKTDLLDLVIDEVFGEIAVPAGGGIGWREATSVFAHSLRRALMRHPWLARLLGGRPNIGPNALRMADRMATIFGDAGLGHTDIDFTVTAVIGYVIGISGTDAAWRETVNASGLTYEEWTEQHDPALRAGTADLPRLRAVIEAQRRLPDTARAVEARFEFGLNCLLDGIAVRVT